MSTFIKFQKFWSFNNIKNIVDFDISSHWFRKSFKNVTFVLFFELFG
jgi:hypothetical protein